MCKKEVEDAPNIVTGTFSIQAQSVDVLFDLGATHFLFLFNWLRH